jgi:hypothetical protein
MRLSNELRSLLLELSQLLPFLPGLHQSLFIQCPPEPTDSEFSHLRELLCRAADLSDSAMGGSRTSGRQKVALRPRVHVLEIAHQKRNEQGPQADSLFRPRRPRGFH